MLPRSLLTLSTIALLATGGVMAAAGPDMNKRGDSDDSKLRVRVDVNAGRHAPAWGRPFPFHPPVVRVEQPVIVEAMPATLDLQAFQAGDTVIVLARGENTTAGFTTFLEREGWRGDHCDGVARITLHNQTVNAPRAQVCSPFAVSGGFETRERLNELRVWVAGQERCLPVAQIAQMPRGF